MLSGAGSLAPSWLGGQCGRAPDRASTQGTATDREREGEGGTRTGRPMAGEARPLKGARSARATPARRADRARPHAPRPSEEGQAGRRARKRQRADRTRAQPSQRAPMCPTRQHGANVCGAKRLQRAPPPSAASPAQVGPRPRLTAKASRAPQRPPTLPTATADG